MNNNFNSHPDKYVNALLTNDYRLVNEIYEEFTSGVTGMVINNSGTVEDAADIFQEALIAIYLVSREKELVLKSGFGPYFKKVCLNKWRDKLEREKKIKLANNSSNEFTSEPTK